MIAIRADVKSDPANDGHCMRANLPGGLLRANLRHASLGAGAIESLAATLRSAAHAGLRSTVDLIVDVLVAVMFCVALAARIAGIFVDVMGHVFAVRMAGTVFFAAPLRVKFVVLVATVTRMADDLFFGSVRLGGCTLVVGDLNFFKRGDQTCHLRCPLTATLGATAFGSRRPRSD